MLNITAAQARELPGNNAIPELVRKYEDDIAESIRAAALRMSSHVVHNVPEHICGRLRYSLTSAGFKVEVEELVQWERMQLRITW